MSRSNLPIKGEGIKCHAKAAIELFQMFTATFDPEKPSTIDISSTVQQTIKTYSANLDKDYDKKTDKLIVQPENLFEIDSDSCTRLIDSIKEYVCLNEYLFLMIVRSLF